MPRRSRLHTPKPHSRPGEKPDFSYLETSPAGAVGRPDVNAKVRDIGHLAYEMVRVLDDPTFAASVTVTARAAVADYAVAAARRRLADALATVTAGRALREGA